jgi:hypothetical protein
VHRRGSPEFDSREGFRAFTEYNIEKERVAALLRKKIIRCVDFADPRSTDT